MRRATKRTYGASAMKANSQHLGASLLELLIALCIVGIMLGLFLPAAWMVYQAALKIGE